EPVDDDGNRRTRGRISRHGVDEKASVRGHVEGHIAGDARVEEWKGYARFERRSAFDWHGHHFSNGRDVEELLAIQAPAWLVSAIQRDRPLAAGRRRIAIGREPSH